MSALRRCLPDWMLSLFPCCLPPTDTTGGGSVSRPRPFRKPTNSFELLLLGTEGSGKSTFIKQMQVIHGMGFTTEERREFISIVHDNIFDAMTILATQIFRLEISLGDPLRENDISSFQNTELPISLRLAAVRSLWSDPGIKETFSKKAEYEAVSRINTSAQYFLDELDRISEAGYLPITADIINARKQTSGVHEYKFRVADIEFKITDVGGGRADRLYWIPILQDRLRAVIFLTAIDEYDSYFKVEGEEGLQNCLQESLNVFGQVQGNPWMPNTSFILFLNKTDVYDKKVQHSKIEKHFPDYAGFQNDGNDGKAYILRKFMDLKTKDSVIYAHYTQATDTENIRVVFDVVRDNVLRMHLRFYLLD